MIWWQGLLWGALGGLLFEVALDLATVRTRKAARERRVLLALLVGATNLSGYPLSRAAQVGSGTVYVVLAQLERKGWVTSWWETRNDDRPRRRFYGLTPEGRLEATRILGLQFGGAA